MFDTLIESTAADAPSTPVQPWHTPWFLVGTRKLVIMSLATFGLYQLHWFFQHWQRLRDVQRQDVWPAARGLLCVVTCHGLFRRILSASARAGVPSRIGAGTLTFAFVAPTLLQKLPDPFWLITLASVAPLVAAQSLVNAMPWVQVVPREHRNERLSRTNWCGVVVGACLWLLVVLGWVMPESWLEESRPIAAEQSVQVRSAEDR